jgi:hypothetical protein
VAFFNSSFAGSTQAAAESFAIAWTMIKFPCQGAHMSTKYRVVKVKGTKPETFIVVGIDFTASIITSTSESMSESEMRRYLQKAGASEKEIHAWIEQSRQYPG